MAKDSSRRSAASAIDGPWLKPQAARALPNANRDFDLSRDPFIRRQILDMEREAASGGGSGRGSRMVRSSQPHPAPKPSHAIRRGPDAASFSDRWLAERRDAAFAQAVPNQSQPTRDRQPNRTRLAPSR